MTAEKQSTGVDFALDPSSGVPLYRQIIQKVEMAMADGRLMTGTQLPTVRALAVTLKINPNTVSRAYNELEIRGIVNTQQGTGTFISDKKIKLSDQERDSVLGGLVQTFLASASSYGFTVDEMIDYISGLKETQE